MELARSGMSRVADADQGANPAADVTVVIPVRDRGRLLDQALASVAAQSLQPAEVIVVDDGSTDGSGDVARRCGARVVRHDVPHGPGRARNTGLALAATTWVAFLDSDDLWRPEHLASLVRAASPDSVLVTAPGVTTNGRWLGNVRGRDTPLSRTSLLALGDGVVTSGTMVRRTVALCVGGCADTPFGEDLALWLRMLAVGPAIQTGRPTVCYRVHDGQLCALENLARGSFEATMTAELGVWLTPGRRTRLMSRSRWDELRASTSAKAAMRTSTWFLRHPSGLPVLFAVLVHRWRGRACASALPDSWLASFQAISSAA